jgi:hypothetical protein
MDTPVTGTPRLLLRFEGAAILCAALVGYEALGASWTLFGLLLLAPDVGMLGYLSGPRVGSWIYNALHTYVGPGALAAITLFGGPGDLWPLCLIWVAHIGMDRALGYGLKFASAFSQTHLGAMGRSA